MRLNLKTVAVRTAVVYALLAAIWILVSDQLVVALFSDPQVIGQVSMYKGWAFVTVTAVLLYLALRTQLRRWEKEATERQLAEGALAQEVEMRRALFAKSPDGVLIVEPKTARPIEFNEAAHRQLGYTREEFARLSIFDLEATETPEETRLRIQTVLREGRADFETQQRTRQGEIRDVHVTAQTIKIQGRDVYHCVWRDITERKRTEEALRQSNQTLSAIIAASPVAIFTLDLEGKVTKWSPAAERVFGWSETEIVGHFNPIVPQDRFAEFWADFRTVTGGREYTAEVRRCRRDGAVLDITISTAPLRNTAGKIVGAVGLMEDITKRKEAEAALRASEERFTRIVETLPNGVAILNLQGQITFANSGAEQLLGLTRGGITQRTYNDPAWKCMTVDGRPFPDDEQPFTRVVRSGEAVYGVEQVVEQPDGRRVVLSINAAPLRDAAGTLIGTVAAFTDVTEQKQAEAALRASEERLRLAQAAAGIGTWDVDLIRDYAAWSEEAEAIFGFAPGTYDHTSDSFWKLLHPEDRERIRLTAERAVIGHCEFEAEYRIFRHGDNAPRWVAVRGKAFHDSSGRAVRMLGVNLDITERKQADHALRESEARYRSLFTSMQEGFALHELICDGAGRPQDYRYLEVNPAFEQMTGIPRERWVGHTVREVLPDIEDYWIQGFGEVALTGVARTFENYVKELGRHYEVLAYCPWRGQFAALTLDVTQRRRVETALRQKTEELDRYFSTALDLFCIVDREGHFRRLNRQWEQTLGYSLAELEGHSFLEFVHPEDREMTEQTNRRALEGLVRNFVNRYRRKDGEYRWIEWSSHPSGTLVFAAARDITERKRAEDAIRRSELSLARAQRVGRLGSWEYDLARGTLEWSDETYRIFGQSPESFAPGRERFLAMVHPEDRARVRAAFEQALATGRAYSVDHRILLPDGAERVVSERADVVTDVGGQVLQLVGTVQDVTELKRIEQALQRSERHFRSIIDTVQDLISIVDIGGVMRFVSPSAERALGYAPEQLLDREVFDFIPADEHAIVRAALARALGDPHQPSAVQHHFRHADGSSRFFESIGNLLGGESAQALVVNSRDITERRRLEEQLRQSQKMEAIGQLAAGVAHDFNNILTIIQGNASLLLGTPGLASEGAVSMTQIIEASERAAGLTRQLLMFSRKQVMQLAELDLNEVVGHMTKMLQRILGEDITLRSEYAPNLPLIRADAGMLEQVLLNLAVNARDAMPGGGQLLLRTEATQAGEQEVAQHPGARAGLHIRLRVADTGCGIAPENLARIFDPFFTTKEVGKGTGLGLATVYGIVNQHHGWIEVASEVGRGTEFQIYLPAREGSVAARRGASAIQELPRGNEVILVVEDEQAVRLLVSNLLQRCGYTVLLAESGVAALTVWQQHKDKVALLLTDMVMPDGMSGRDLARELQQDKPSLRVIFTSGYSATTGGESPVLTEGVNFLQKPYPPHHLAKTVRAYLDRK